MQPTSTVNIFAPLKNAPNTFNIFPVLLISLLPNKECNQPVLFNIFAPLKNATECKECNQPVLLIPQPVLLISLLP